MANNPTKDEIKKRLDELGVEYLEDDKKDVLLAKLDEAVNEGSENEAEDSNDTEEVEEAEESETEEPEEEVEEATGELSKAEYRAKKGKKRPESSNEIAHRVIAGKEAQKEKKINSLLKKKGYDWYRADARVVLSDNRITKPGFYYPVHKNDADRVGTFMKATDKRASRKQIESGKVQTNQKGFILEKAPKLVKETPKQGAKRRDAQEEFDANDFVG